MLMLGFEREERRLRLAVVIGTAIAEAFSLSSDTTDS